MEYADQADLTTRWPEREFAGLVEPGMAPDMALERALELEMAAAMLLKDTDLEPTRGILFSSAASLAWQVGDLPRAKELVEIGQAGPHCPEFIREKLKDILALVEQKEARREQP
jgi:hypothetical protein